jgi:predicted nucleic acid-binding protein
MLVAKNRLKFIDALHVATAEDAQCRYLLTNDAGIKSTENMEVILLSTMLDAT